jgi:hypothetical protein
MLPVTLTLLAPMHLDHKSARTAMLSFCQTLPSRTVGYDGQVGDASGLGGFGLDVGVGSGVGVGGTGV